MLDDVQAEVNSATEAAEPEKAPESGPPEAPQSTAPKPESRPQGPRAQGQPKREDRPPRPENRGPHQGNEKREGRPGGERPGGDRRPDDRRPAGDRREGRPGGGRPFEMAPEIELEKLISDSLYLDNQAHAVVARMRDMDSGTKSQLRRLYNAVRRAVRAPESERQHHFVMLRARLAYTIARHSLRSLDALERLLLQVTRRNDARGYERFKDLFEAIVAYNE
jgi:CRISPR type III-A-associated protein Csm2